MTINPFKLINYIFNPLGIHLSRLTKTEPGDYDSYMTTPKYFNRLKDELEEVAYSFLSNEDGLIKNIDKQKLKSIIDDFFFIYPKRPIKKNVGGSRFHNCFWLYIIAKYLNPELIIESGVWKGQSSWMLRQACPEATIHSFDISFRKLLYKDRTINYHKMDWENFEFENVDTDKSLCFFDDHIDQTKRIKEAHKRGFRNLIMDEMVPAHKLFTFGLPPFPNVPMLFDNFVKDKETIEWVWKGKNLKYEFVRDYEAKELVTSYDIFPDVASLTRYTFHGFMGWVKLRD